MDFIDFIQELGKGTYGVVNLCIKKHNKHKVVIKEIDLDKYSEHLNEAQNEVNIMKTLNHPNVIKYHDSYIRNGKFHIMMEYASKGCLHEFIARNRPNLLEAQVVMNLFVQILMGLNHIHSKKILHRDLKPQNVFLTGLKADVLKIGDFGISKILRNLQTKTFIGTHNYLSPEICNGSPYDFKSDIWAMGCILHELCVLERTFEGDLKDIMFKTRQGIRKPIDVYKYGQQMQNIINDLLNLNPTLRPSTLELMAYPDIFPTLHIIGVDLGCIM